MNDSQRGKEILERIEMLPDGTWRRCPGCTNMLHREQLRLHHGTCPECGHHLRLGARERITAIVDSGTFVEHDADLAPGDPLSLPIGCPTRSGSTGRGLTRD
jgi:acetyl-CoA carboxylase carboxyl transferase subunit beta